MPERSPSPRPVKIPLLAAALAAALVAASPTAFAQQRVPTHVACVGDSITYGYLASNQATKSYPADLQTIFGSSVMVRNFGRNSATLLSNGDQPYISASLGPEYANATSFVSGAGASAVVDVIIMLGTNDSKPGNWMNGARATQYMTDLGNMVDHFTSLSTHPVVYLALPPAIYTNSFGISESVTSGMIDPIIMQVATQKGMPVIDVHTPTSGHMEYFQDGVHPTDAGYMLLAQIMHDGLLAAGGGTGGRGGSGGGGAGGRGGSGGAGGRGGSGGGAGTGGAGGGAAGRGGAAGGAAGRGGSSGSTGAGGAAAGAGGGGGGMAGAGGASAGRGGAGGSAAGTGGSTGGGGIGGASTGSGGSAAGGSSGPGTGGAGPGTGGSSTGTGGSGPAGSSGGDAMSGGGGGCGCSAGATPRVSGLIAAFVLIGLVLRRRRARAPSGRQPVG